jgi:hypothetical protein
MKNTFIPYAMFSATMIFVVLLFSSIPDKIYAQSNPSTIKNVGTTEVSGEVVQKNNNTITVKTTDGIKELALANSVPIKKDYTVADVSHVQTNDKVNILATNNGQVLSVEAYSKPMDTIRTLFLPFMVLLIGFILYTQYRRSKSGAQFIKTTVTGVSQS